MRFGFPRRGNLPVGWLGRPLAEITRSAPVKVMLTLLLASGAAAERAAVSPACAKGMSWAAQEVKLPQKSTKHQHPRTRESPNSKHQPRLRKPRIAVWRLVILWSLDVGAWCFSKVVMFGAFTGV